MEHPFQDFVIYRVKQLYRDFSALYDRHLAAFGLTAGQVNVLEQLWVNGDGLTQKQLHERLAIRPASLTNLLDSLVNGNWVTRKPDSQDARVKRIYLTETGKAQGPICMRLIRQLEEQLRNGLAPADIERITAGLRQMQLNIPER